MAAQCNISKFFGEFYEAVAAWDGKQPEDFNIHPILAFDALALYLGAFRFKDHSPRSPVELLLTSSDRAYVISCFAAAHGYALGLSRGTAVETLRKNFGATTIGANTVDLSKHILVAVGESKVAVNEVRMNDIAQFFL